MSGKGYWHIVIVREGGTWMLRDGFADEADAEAKRNELRAEGAEAQVKAIRDTDLPGGADRWGPAPLEAMF